MKYCLAVFSSITYANRVKKMLNNKVGYIALMHTPAAISETGCSYCLRFRASNLQLIRDTALNSEIKVRGYYEENGTNYKRVEP